MTPAEAFIEELATRVAAKVIEELRHSPTLQSHRRVFYVRQAAEFMGRTEKAIRHMVASGKLKKLDIDGSLQFDIRDLEMFLANSRE